MHRDFKPANILMKNDYQAVICDFGLARGISQDDNLTQKSLTKSFAKK